MIVKLVERLQSAHNIALGFDATVATCLRCMLGKPEHNVHVSHLPHLCLFKCNVEYLEVHASYDAIGFKKHRYQLLRH